MGRSHCCICISDKHKLQAAFYLPQHGGRFSIELNSLCGFVLVVRSVDHEVDCQNGGPENNHQHAWGGVENGGILGRIVLRLSWDQWPGHPKFKLVGRRLLIIA